MATSGCRSSRSRHGPVARARRSPQKRARNSSILGSSHAAEERFVTRISTGAVHPRSGSGDEQLAGDRVRRAGAKARRRAEGAHAAFSEARLGRARRRRDLGDDPGLGPKRPEGGRAPRPRSRRDRDHQPARDHRPLGPARPAAPFIARSSGRIAARRPPRTASARPATRPPCAGRPGSFSTRTSPARSSAWLLDHVPGARKKAAEGRLASGTVDSWLVWNLTGGRRHVTDVSNASRTMLMNLRTGRWDAELLPASCDPARVPSRRSSSSGGHDRGHRRRRPRRQRAHRRHRSATSRPPSSASSARVPVSPSAPTAPAASSSQFTGDPARASRTSPSLDGGLAIGEGPMTYALEGSVFVRRRGRPVAARRPRDHPRRPRTSTRWPRSVPDSGGVVVVPAFTGLGAPQWDATARGAVLGLTRGSTAGPPRAGHARRHRVPGRRPAERDGGGHGHAASRAPRRRRRRGERPAHAAPGRISRA